ncbi:hypothetical protein OWR28_08035 [Chryseobacterium sp. 1B4]
MTKSLQYNEYTKELQSNGNLDYGWRQYMHDLGRWNGMDVLSESYQSTSPYAYVMNNPVLKIDPNGMLSQAFMDEISSSASGTTWTNNNNGTFTNNWGGMMNSKGRALNYRLSAINSLNNDGGGSGPKPGFWGSAGIFLRKLFSRDKGAGISTIVPGAAISRIPALEIGNVTFRGILSSASIDAVILGITRAGVWSLPLMLNGDSGFSANSKPITGAIDIPVTTTADESEPEFEYFYRAMSSKEYLSTGGFLQQKSDQSGNYRGEGPFVTDRLEYAERALNGFSKKDKYDLIVQYTMQPGTTNLLNSISLPHGPGVTGAYSEKLGLPIKKVELGGTNYGFYGSNVNIFNIRLMGPPIPIRYK